MNRRDMPTPPGGQRSRFLNSGAPSPRRDRPGAPVPGHRPPPTAPNPLGM